MKRAMLLAALWPATAFGEPPAGDPAPPDSVPAAAQDPEKELGERAARFFDDGRYDEALQALAAGYRRFGKPLYLFNIAQVQRQRKHCQEALTAYEQFLAAAAPDDQQHRNVAERQAGEMRRCVSLMTAPPAAAVRIAALPRAPEPTARGGRIMKNTGIALLVAGVVSAVGATVLGLQARRDSDRLSTSSFESPDYLSLKASGERANRWAIALAAGAGVTAGAGVALVILAPATRPVAPRAAAGAQMLVSWSGRL
jgi:tetratricopeptide (TPR) repeat protein